MSSTRKYTVQFKIKLPNRKKKKQTIFQEKIQSTGGDPQMLELTDKNFNSHKYVKEFKLKDGLPMT